MQVMLPAWVCCFISGCSGSEYPSIDTDSGQKINSYNVIDKGVFISMQIKTPMSRSAYANDTRDDLFTQEAGVPSIGDEFQEGNYDEFAIAPGEHHFGVLFGEDLDSPLAILELYGLAKDNNSSSIGSLLVSTVISRSLNPSGNISTRDLKDLMHSSKECYVILNTDLHIDDLGDISRENLLNLVSGQRYSIKSDDGIEYFTMSNSVYFNNDNSKSYGFNISSNNVFESLDEARMSPAVTVYVERMAAKFTVAIANGLLDKDNYFNHALGKLAVYSENPSVSGYESKDFRIKLLGCGINALEKESYYFKKIGEGESQFFQG